MATQDSRAYQFWYTIYEFSSIEFPVAAYFFLKVVFAIDLDGFLAGPQVSGHRSAFATRLAR